MQLPAVVVTFDDGTSYEVQPKARDAVHAERAGFDFTKGLAVASLYAAALAALKRMQRNGDIPDDVTLPATLDAFVDCADVEPVNEPDAEGKVSDPAPSTGQ